MLWLSNWTDNMASKSIKEVAELGDWVLVSTALLQPWLREQLDPSVKQKHTPWTRPFKIWGEFVSMAAFCHRLRMGKRQPLAHCDLFNSPRIWQRIHCGQTTALSLAQNVGLLVGAGFWGIGCNIFGRRWAFNLTIGITSIFGLVAAGSPSFDALDCFVAFWSFGVGGAS